MSGTGRTRGRAEADNKHYHTRRLCPDVDSIPFECQSLDNILEGGVERGCLTLLYGEAGSGKTNLCLVLARNVVNEGKKVFYVDTEGVSMERLRQISGDHFDNVSENILFSEVHTFRDQQKMVDRGVKVAEANDDIGMIVVDSITMYYRSSSRGELSERKNLAWQVVNLLRAARRQKIPAVITTQVFTDVEKGTYEALGGHAMHHAAKTIVRLDKLSAGKRRAVIMKHRHLPEGMGAEFRITQDGITC